MEEAHRAHRAAKSGVKAERKRRKLQQRKGILPKGTNNFKAFSVKSAVRARLQRIYAAEKLQKKEHAIITNRMSDEPPPILVAIVGPKGVGKSTLMRSLVKHYAKVNLHSCDGPVTVVANRNRRITLVECPNDIHSMIDVGKVADQVLQCIDASFGFEMETFEFLNILKTHGFPRIMGILTKQDTFKKIKQVRKQKKSIRHRFHTEVYDGAKVFYFNGIKKNRYNRREVQNLTRFLSSIKFRPLQWRNQHPYIYCDRVEDITPIQQVETNNKIDRTISLYGYVRGTNLKLSQNIHLMGVGDFTINTIDILHDPLPLPTHKSITSQDTKDTKYRRSLKDKERQFYAPMSDISEQVYDKDATYIQQKNRSSTDEVDNDINTNNTTKTIDELDGNSQQKTQKTSQDKTIDKQLNDEYKISIFKDGDKITARQFDTLQLVRDGKEKEFQEYLMNENESGNEEGDDGGSGNEEGDDGGSGNEEGDDGGSDNDTNSVLNKFGTTDDDIYDRMTIEEVRQDDGTIRRRVIFKNADKESKNVDGDGSDSDSCDNNDGDSDNNDGSDSCDNNDGSDIEYSDLSDIAEIEQSGLSETDRSKNALPNVSGELSLKWKENLLSRAEERFKEPSRTLNEQIYGNRSKNNKDIVNDTNNNDNEEFFIPLEEIRQKNFENFGIDVPETNVRIYDTNVLQKYDIPEVCQSLLKKRFLLDNDDSDNNGDDNNDNNDKINDNINIQDDELLWIKNTKQVVTKGQNPDKFEDEERDNIDKNEFNETDDDSNNNTELTERQQLEQKIQKKYKFLKEQEDEEMNESTNTTMRRDNNMRDPKERPNLQIQKDEEFNYFSYLKSQELKKTLKNREEYEKQNKKERLIYQGAIPGTYVRIVLENVPCEFINNQNYKYPIIIGGQLTNEQNLGILQARIKKHRWHSKQLKSNEALIFSLGWRRFQSIPIFSIEDPNNRLRYQKYTPMHMHCQMTFYGPITSINTGQLCLRSSYIDGIKITNSFRISGTGTLIDINKTCNIVKKLKLIGTPLKVYRNTAFIKDMFTSSQEVTKFEGAKIRTVSGIRGEIKKSINYDGKDTGIFRATFEDTINKNDIIFCRTWINIQPYRYYNPLCTYLQSSWNGIRMLRDIRADKGQMLEHNEDSQYADTIHRKNILPQPFKQPKSIIEKLPIHLKPKLMKKLKSKKMTLSKLHNNEIDKDKDDIVINSTIHRLGLIAKMVSKQKKERVKNLNKRKKLKSIQDSNRSLYTKKRLKKMFSAARERGHPIRVSSRPTRH